MNQELAESSQMHPDTVQKVFLEGDLSSLNPAEKLDYYQRVCASLGLNPLTKPFEFIKLGGRLVMYARRECTEQLARIHGVSFPDPPITNMQSGVYTYMVRVVNQLGRVVYATGAVGVEGLKGETLANAILKAETKAHRRGVLKICGLGLLDETEVESVLTLERQAAPSWRAANAQAMQAMTQSVRETDPAPVQEAAPAKSEALSQEFPPGSIDAEDIAGGLDPTLPGVVSIYQDQEAWDQTIREIWAASKRDKRKQEIFYRLKSEYAPYLPTGTRLLEALPVKYRELFAVNYQRQINEIGN